MVGRSRQNQKGFTLVEILLAMAVFSFVLTICLAVFIQVNRLYYRGISISKSQETARGIIGELSNRMQTNAVVQSTHPLADALVPGNPSVKQGYFCIGDIVYYYKLGYRQVDIPTVGPQAVSAADGGAHVLARWTKSNFCTTEAPDPANFRVDSTAVDLVDDNTALYHFIVVGSRIEMTIVYGSPTQIDPASVGGITNGDVPNIRCDGGRDVTFCGISELESEVVTRTR